MSKEYPYGSKDTTPHVHVYGGDCHIQINHRGRTRRYNIVQDGKLHVQHQDALEAAEGNETLLEVIRGVIAPYQ